MEKVTAFLQDNSNRYSFHFLAWIVYVFIFLGCVIFSYLIQLTGTLEFNSYCWYLIIAYICFYPFIFGLIVFIYARLHLKERRQPEFRIKNKFIAENHFYRTFIILSVVISILFFIALLVIPVLAMIVIPCPLLMRLVGFIDPLYVIFICIIILYLLGFLIK